MHLPQLLVAAHISDWFPASSGCSPIHSEFWPRCLVVMIAARRAMAEQTTPCHGRRGWSLLRRLLKTRQRCLCSCLWISIASVTGDNLAPGTTVEEEKDAVAEGEEPMFEMVEWEGARQTAPVREARPQRRTRRPQARFGDYVSRWSWRGPRPIFF